MKKIALILAALMAAAFLGGCQAEGSTSQPEDSSQSGESSSVYVLDYDPYRLPSIIEEGLGDSLETYKEAVDAIESYAESVSVADEEEFEKVSASLREFYPPSFLAEEMTYLPDTKEMKFSYRYNSNAHARQLTNYSDFLSAMFRVALREGDNDTAMAMAEYLYATTGLFTSEKAEITAWDTVISAETDHNGYALLLEQLLLQSGIDCIKVESAAGDGTPHLMVLVNLGGSYFILDPYSELYLSDGTGLAGFGMTAADCEKNGFSDDFKIRAWDGFAWELPTIDDTRFAELRGCFTWEFSEEDRNHIIITVAGNESEWGPLEESAA